MYYHIVKTCDVDLWGLSSEQRLERVLSKCGSYKRVYNLGDVPFDQLVLILRADYLYDEAALRRLVQRKNILLRGSSGEFPVAGIVEGRLAKLAADALEDEKSVHHSSLMTIKPADLSGGFQARLRKLEQTHVLRISSSRQRMLENYLYDKSYKGITDLVTKWAWPYPARWCVRRCVNLKLTPNVVTSAGLLLTIIAGYLFMQGLFLPGLIAGWIMTFLDTVDGKLARVTMQSSKVGHVLDHGLDILHPPLWYWLWAIGLGVSQIEVLGTTWSTQTLVWLMFGGYLAGRIFEGLFQLMFNDLSIFCWKKLDSYHRLITARRNPCLIILTVAVVMGLPVQGFVGVVIWTLLSSAFLFYRFAAGIIFYLQHGPLRSWIEKIDMYSIRQPITVRLFAGARLNSALLARDAF